MKRIHLRTPRSGYRRAQAVVPSSDVDPCTGVAEPVVIHDYDPEWPRRFAELRDALIVALDGLSVTVEHVGSTAIPGLAAKPVIDVDVVVESSRHLADVIDRLRGLGYEHLGELGVPGREAFRTPAPESLEGQSRLRAAHHLYVVRGDGREPARHRAFRDALRANPAPAEEYAALKRRLACELGHDRAAHTEAKAAFISATLGRVPST